MFLFILLGLGTGILSGLIGIGGGVVLIPALVYFFKFTQHKAQGTTLALFSLPIAILAAWSYYKKGYVDLKVTGLLLVGFLVGSVIGAYFANQASDEVLRKIFGGVLFVVSLYILLFQK